jgi:hypothetical protein
MPDYPNETRLIGAHRTQRGGVRIFFIRVRPYSHHLNRARGVKALFIHRTAYLDVVPTDIVHSAQLLNLEKTHQRQPYLTIPQSGADHPKM